MGQFAFSRTFGTKESSIHTHILSWCIISFVRCLHSSAFFLRSLYSFLYIFAESQRPSGCVCVQVCNEKEGVSGRKEVEKERNALAREVDKAREICTYLSGERMELEGSSARKIDRPNKESRELCVHMCIFLMNKKDSVNEVGQGCNKKKIRSSTTRVFACTQSA